MKNQLCTLLLLLVFGGSLSAQRINNSSGREHKQEKTLFNNGGSFGGFIGVGVKGGDVNGQSGVFVGGELSAVFSHRMNIGFVGYGLATEVDADTRDEDGQLLNLEMGYGGLLLEPVIASHSVVHVTVPMIFGVGGAGLYRKNTRRFFDDDNITEDDWLRYRESDVFLVAEPGLNIEINLLRFVRLDVGGTYRYIYDNNLDGLSDEELSGFTGSVTLKLGWF